jgi:hypothetical protein
MLSKLENLIEKKKRKPERDLMPTEKRWLYINLFYVCLIAQAKIIRH